jgi:hypothetical protein
MSHFFACHFIGNFVPSIGDEILAHKSTSSVRATLSNGIDNARNDGTLVVLGSGCSITLQIVVDANSKSPVSDFNNKRREKKTENGMRQLLLPLHGNSANAD